MPSDDDDAAKVAQTWNYRLILHDDESDPWIGLHEVHYRGADANDLTNVIGWTEKPIDFVCDADEGAVGIVSALEAALKDARDRPIISMNELFATERKSLDER